MSAQAAAQPQQLTEAQVPLLQQQNPQVLLVASFLRNHPLLKLRQGSVNGQLVDFFRYKRCIRALTSEDYQLKTKKLNLPLQPNLLNNPQLAQQFFVQLISNQLVIPVKKLSTQDARKLGFKPTKKTPCLEPANKCVLADNEYFYWTFLPQNPWLPVYAVLVIVGLLILVCFPLWPMFMRRGAWYVSMLMLGLIGLLFVVAIVRLFVFLVLSPFTKFWIFPNLFADVGFVDSFIPLYEFEVSKVKSKKGKKNGKNEGTLVEKSTSSSNATGVENGATKTIKRKVTMEEVEE